MKRLFGGILMWLALSGVALWGEPMIDFSGYNSGGTISSGGLGTSVTGGGILIGGLNGVSVEQNGGSHAVSSGILDFETGTITSVNVSGNQYTYNYNGGGSFTIRGNVPDAGITGNPVLVSGSFYDGSFTITDMGASYLIAFQGTGPNDQNGALLAYFGLPEVPYRFTGYSFAAQLNGDVGRNGSFSGTAMSTDIVNTATPEPSAILLLGSCLLLIGGLLRRKMNRERALHRAD